MSSTWKLMWLIKQFPEDFSMDSFDDRKWLQKLVVLAQEFGIPLEYDFGWYRHGPYSSELTDDGFTIDSVPEISWNEYIDASKMEQYQLDLERLKEFIDDVKDEFDDLSEADMLELLASLIFVAKHTYPKLSRKEDIFHHLEKSKPFSGDQLKKAWKILADKDLVKL